MADEYLRRIHHVYKYHYVCDGDTDSQHKQWMRNPDLRVLAIPAFCRDWREFVNGLVLLEQSNSRPDAESLLMPFGRPSHILRVCTSNTNNVCRNPHSACSSACVRA